VIIRLGLNCSKDISAKTNLKFSKIRMIGYVNVSIDIRNDNKDTVIDIPFVDDQTLGRGK